MLDCLIETRRHFLRDAQHLRFAQAALLEEVGLFFLMLVPRGRVEADFVLQR